MLKKHTISIKHAIEGILWAFSTQPNFNIHLLLSLVTIIAGVIFKIDLNEWVLITLTIFIGLVIEMANTAIECLGDAITSEHNQHIKRAKDVSAGMMFLYALGAVLVAGFVFVPKIVYLFPL